MVLSRLCLLESPTVHEGAVVVEHPPCSGIVEGIVRADLCSGCEPAHEAGLLAVDQRVGSAVPGVSPSLDEAEQVDEQRGLAHVVHDVLEPPSPYDLLLVDGPYCSMWLLCVSSGFTSLSGRTEEFECTTV